jgi:hypothetical protein
MAAAAKTYNDWKRLSMDIGCIFARTIASRPPHYGQAVEVVSASGSPNLIANSIAKRVDRLIAKPMVSSAALILPAITSLDQFLQTVMALKEKPGWDTVLAPLQQSAIGDALSVAVTRQVPISGGQILPSEVLALGPFDEFPPTRRAPITALELFVGEPPAVDPKSGKQATRLNLAHIDPQLPTTHAFQAMWDRSVAGRLKSLGGQEDTRAKAKVTFVVPVGIAEKLGYWP